MDNADIGDLADTALAGARSAFTYFHQPSAIIQLLVIAACYLLAWLLYRLTHQPIEEQARRIKGAPGILRIIVAFRRRLQLFYFVLLLWMVTVVDRVVAVRPSRLVWIVLALAAAYFAIAVISRIVRNRLLARIITIVASVMAALSILDLTMPVATALDAAAITIGSSRISALLVLKAIAVIVVTLWIAMTVGRFLDRRVQRSEELTPTLRVLIGKVLKFTLIVVGLAVALASIGVDLTAFTVLSGALGVGLGFGLQKVVSNFISGIIILLDRSIKPGDTISLDDTFGWIRELHARYVSVGTRDGKEYLIPNEDFITGRVINWSFTNELVRIDVRFHASYDCDPHEVIRIAKEATIGVNRVVTNKGAVCWLTGFGDYALEYVVRFWISDPPAGLANVKGQVLLAIWDAFKANGITVPYPRREITIRSAPSTTVSSGAGISDVGPEAPDDAAAERDDGGSATRAQGDPSLQRGTAPAPDRR
ncbi:mechanosensitive ion channel family protein [Mangrovicella endophytica]|uniref:mechanosensitive ion channel family protein n=1 Tax=Mangrovicella endophytica TaxID=2066697 RepID=UPI000C9E20E8|nr:mechanosensitive ion channel domain-containing protein [Mangrovicella endophytica]